MVENLTKFFQARCLVQFFWKGLEVHRRAKQQRKINDWKGGVEVLKVVILLTEVLIKVKGEWMPTVWVSKTKLNRNP